MSLLACSSDPGAGGKNAGSANAAGADSGTVVHSGEGVGGTGGSGAASGGSGAISGDPIELAAIGANETVGLEWPIVPAATGYNVYWGMAPGVTIASGQRIPDVERGYVHRGLTNDQTYYYIVTPLTAAGEGAASVEASATPTGEWVLEQLGTGDFDSTLAEERVPVVPIEKRIHVLLFGEGYTADDLDVLHDHDQHFTDRANDIDRWVDLVFSIEPYSLYPEAFVVWYLPRASATTIRDATPNTAFQVPIVIADFPQMGSVSSSGETARLAWEAIALHPYAPTDFSGPGGERARNAIASFLIFDPNRNRASVSGLATSLTNPNATRQRIGAAFGVGHAHEFSHAFSLLRDEYLEDNNSAPSSWSETSNVVGTNQCSSLPWAHLLLGTEINPSVDDLVGAFGHPERGYHPELLCLMNGTHDNGQYFAGDDSGSCNPDSCTLRVEDRFCNFCREITALRIFQRSSLLATDVAGVGEWAASYRHPFFERFEFQVPGLQFPGTLPQSNDTRNPANGTQIFQACVP